MENKFEVGQTVISKAGGPFMIVKEVYVTEMLCFWFDKDDKYHQAIFIPNTIELVQNEKNPEYTMEDLYGKPH